MCLRSRNVEAILQDPDISSAFRKDSKLQRQVEQTSHSVCQYATREELIKCIHDGRWISGQRLFFFFFKPVMYYTRKKINVTF